MERAMRWLNRRSRKHMTGKSLVQRPVRLAAGSSTGLGAARGSDSDARGQPRPRAVASAKSESMRSPFPRARKTQPSSNIDITPTSNSTSRTIGGRLLGRPASHKTSSGGAQTSSESSVSRSSALTSLTRFRAANNQPASSHLADSYSRNDEDNRPAISASTTSLPALHHGPSSTNILSSSPPAGSRTATVTPVALPSASATESTNTHLIRPRGLVGLQNLGNTCFMNSCLQCVSNIPAVVQYFQSGSYLKETNDESTTKGTLANAYGELIQALSSTTAFSSTRPVDLKRVIGKVATRFNGYDQQDAQEFLRFFLDGLHEELNRIRKKPPYYEIKDRENVADREVSDEYWKVYRERNLSALSELFCGQLRSEIRCHTCNHRSLCFDVFWDLSVPVPKKTKQSAHMRFASVFSTSSSSSSAASSDSDSSSPSSSGYTIQDCLRAYTEPEALQEHDAYYCSKCKTHRAVTKKISLYRLPPVLVVHLKRFSYSTFSRDKVNTAIKFPTEGLNLAEYCAQDAVIDGSSLYDLTGVVHHFGSLHGGHYTAECKNADTQEWYDFNDATVSLVKKSQICSASAYILFFRRRDEQSLTI
ncbi:hypothetical protein Poli38472_001097 [Pythium oligandrum]|uniref:Ubiquitin carboxyl-terminal hydrolase n=1 Tax=Pythium oligandrum TaxID=41045 RepID=A0A8K1FN29_PYTOL|nr:hypothetical protein Poli38472_001097 [Pythium oligandrum]|eukprot:TMW68941.1 hypothetical protein Poli38472_001097 [Pythium oligandrum]